MADGNDLPIALRRTRRSSYGVPMSPISIQDNESDGVLSSCLAAKTSSKRTRSKKRVRFSDPGPIISSPAAPSTGLTPMIRRTSLIAYPKRRHSTPARPCARSASGMGLSRLDGDDVGTPKSEEVNILPLRQVLDGRVKRRIRRNGLSEEMNTIYAEKRRRTREAKEEVDRLRAEMAEKDEEIARLQDETVVTDTERVWTLEKQVEELKKELAHRSGGADCSSPSYDWTMAAKDPFSDDFMDLDPADDADVEEFGDSSMADLVCSTPTRRARSSFPTPPTTSPAAAPMTPCSHLSTPRSHTGVQARLPDPQKQQLEDELASLQLELCKLTTTLESYSSFATRVSAKLSPFNPDTAAQSDPQSSSPHPEIDAHITALLQTLSDRTAALLDLTSTISALGFPGPDPSSILTSISTAFRTARLELEYLTPGEIALPLTSTGAAVLDLLLAQLRDLARKSKESEDSIDEYHALELSLRQQLSARVDVTDDLNRQVQNLNASVAEKDARIEDQSIGLERLKGAVASYARDVRELETLVQKLEGEKTTAVSELEGRLVEQTAALEGKLDSLRTTHASALSDIRKAHKDEISNLNRSHGTALALRDARVVELRGEIERVNSALRSAHETIRKLRVENAQVKNVNEALVAENKGLSTSAESQRRKAKEVVDGMRAELERVVRMSEGLLATPRKKKSTRRDSALRDEDDDEVCLVQTPSSSDRRGSFLSADLAKRGGERKRRRYDSGLGFLDEEEVNVDA